MKKSGRYKKSKSEGKIAHKITIVDGITFHSKMESEYYEHLKVLKANGEVIKFELQPKFLLQDKFIIVDGKIIYGSDVLFEKTKRKNKSVTIRAIEYISDFKIWYTNGLIKTVDTKGQSTPEFEIKKKMLLHMYPEIDLEILIKDKGEWVDFYNYKAEQRARKRAKAKLKGETV